MEILTILIVAILVEALWENIKLIYQDNKINWQQLIILAISIVVSILTKINIFKVLNIEIVEIAGSLLTGILISRGANVFHDVFKKIEKLKGE